MLKYGQTNPLNVMGLREVSHRPPHFTQVCFDLRTKEKTIKDWIYEHLAGRFWIGDVYVKSDQGFYISQKAVAFETSSEASYFALFLDQINKYQFEV